MLINAENLRAITRGFRALIKDEMPKVKPIYQRIAMVVSSTGSSENYSFLADLGLMDEWKGDRTKSNLQAHDFEIKNKDWQKSVSVHKNDIEDDKLGLIEPKIRTIAYAPERTRDKIIIDLLVNGFSSVKSYDKKAFFSASHDSGSNLGTVEFSDVNYAAALEAMMAQVDDEGEPLDVYPDILMVGPGNWDKARKVIKAVQIEGTTNVYQNEVEVIRVPRFKNGEWVLLDCRWPIRPLILQNRSLTEPRFIVEPGENMPEGLFGNDGRFNAGVTLHQLAYGSKPAQG